MTDTYQLQLTENQLLHLHALITKNRNDIASDLSRSKQREGSELLTEFYQGMFNQANDLVTSIEHLLKD